MKLKYCHSKRQSSTDAIFCLYILKDGKYIFYVFIVMHLLSSSTRIEKEFFARIYDDEGKIVITLKTQQHRYTCIILLTVLSADLNRVFPSEHQWYSWLLHA